ncbi:MAG: amidohydrolase family protein [Proteobacteria bacterium]|nr:amidohydrolase family protein [Pseudomonadota bacterium]
MEIIDIHTHGIGGYDTGDSTSEAILKMAEIHGAHGVNVIIPTIYSAPIHVMRENMAAVKKAMEQQRADNSKLNTQNSTLPSLIFGVHLEGPFLNPSRCGALDASSFLKPDESVLKELTEGFADMVKIITIAPELEGSLKLIKQARGVGINVSMGHSDATFNEAEEGFHRGARGITHIFNAMRSIHHREPGIAGFGLSNRDVFIELIADPFHLHSEMIRIIFAIKNPDKIILISDSTKEAQRLSREMSEVKSQTLKTQNLYGSIPTEEGQLKTVLPIQAGLIRGGAMTVTESAHRLIDMGFDEEIVLKCITENPATYLGISYQLILFLWFIMFL